LPYSLRQTPGTLGTGVLAAPTGGRGAWERWALVHAALKSNPHLLKLELQSRHSFLKDGELLDKGDKRLLSRAEHAAISNNKYNINDGHYGQSSNGSKI